MSLTKATLSELDYLRKRTGIKQVCGQKHLTKKIKILELENI